MIPEWLTANEIAQHKLPGMPATQPGILNRAKTESWKSRARSASGGGTEYHISALPPAAQVAVIENLLSKEKMSSIKFGAVYEAKPISPPSAYSEDDKRNAKLIIVKIFDKFRATSCLSIMQAEPLYLSFYEREKHLPSSDYFPAWIFEIYPAFSVQSLRLWRKLRSSEDALKALSGKYGNRKGSGTIETAEHGEMRKYLIALITKQPHLTGGHLRDLCRARWGETVGVENAKGYVEQKELPSVRTFERFMTSWKAENAEMHLRLTNPDGHKNRYMMSLGKADASIVRLNQLWEIDASPADVLCKDGRYSIYGIIDVYSRRVMYMTTKTPRTEAALLLIRRAVMEWGVPETIRTDNGSDFTSKRFINALIGLGVEQDICPPFSGDKKAFVERHFRTLQHDLMPLLPGYIGHSVKDRKEIESRKAFAKRLGEDADKAFAVELSHHDLQEMIDTWAKQRFQHSPHGGLNGDTPFKKAASWTSPIRRIENERALDLLLAPIAGSGGIRRIGKKGLSIDSGQFWSDNLIPHIGKEVLVKCDPENMGVVYCFDDKGKFITEARCFERDGVNPVAAAAAVKVQQKAFERLHIDPLKKEMRKITPAKMASDVLGLAVRDNSHLVALPKNTETYESNGLREAAKAATPPLERASDELRTAHEAFEEKFNLRKAAAHAAVESDEDRWWKRAVDIEKRILNKLQVSDSEYKWLATARKQHWYIARASFELLKSQQSTTV